jgi:tRNA threonylcarbamoyladenosine biosynthesis protein TsaE
MFKEVKSESEMKIFGELVGSLLCGGESIELIGDVGSGKTTLTKGIAVGLGIEENVQSPSFTISHTYEGRDDLVLSHYDFYRLDDAGIMANELKESTSDPSTITVVEWAGVVGGVLPMDRLSIHITSPTETSRQIVVSSNGLVSDELARRLVL